MDSEHSGACLCGAVRFKARGELREVVACHCSQCRRQTGHFLAATNVADENLAIEGDDNLRWYRASSFARRGFCGNCGSVMFWKTDSETYTSITAGTFDQPTGLKLAYHIFCKDKGDYYDITDGLPAYDVSSPGLVVAEN